MMTRQLMRMKHGCYSCHQSYVSAGTMTERLVGRTNTDQCYHSPVLLHWLRSAAVSTQSLLHNKHSLFSEMLNLKCLQRILNKRWQQRIRNKEIMKRTGISFNVVQGMRKLNFFDQNSQMQDDRLIKQVVCTSQKTTKTKQCTNTKQRSNYVHISKSKYSHKKLRK